MEKLLNELLLEIKELKALQQKIADDQISLRNDNAILKQNILYLKDGQQEKNTLIKHTLTLQIENMLEIKQSLRHIEEHQNPNTIPEKPTFK